MITVVRNAILLVAVACVGCRPAPRTTVFIDPALSTLVPADTVFLAGLRLDKLRDTPAYKKFLSSVPLPGAEQFRRETGIDPQKDLWEFLIAGNGRQSVVMCRGKFAEFGLEPKTPRPEMKRFSYRNYMFMGDDETALMFPNSSTAVAGPTPLLRSIIDNRDKGGLGIPKSLLPLVNAVPAQSQIWIAGDVGAELSGLNPGEHGEVSNFSQFAKAIQTAWAGLDFRDGMKADGSATCRTDTDAQRLNSTVRAAVGIARLNTPPERTDLLRAWDSIRSEIQNSRIVNVHADLKEAELEALYGFAKSARGLGLPGRR
jgi:hypothetical protein